MSVIHTVFLKFKEGTSEETIKEFFSKLEALKKEILGIINFQGGRYESKEGLNQEFNHAFIMTFDSEESRDKYLQHPTHQELAKEIVQTLKDGINGVIAFDFSQKNHPLTPRSVIDIAKHLLQTSREEIQENPEKYKKHLEESKNELQTLANNLKNNSNYGARLFGNRKNFKIDFNEVNRLLDEINNRLQEIQENRPLTPTP